jgi:uncharacterized protein YecE (DUF72 family)
MKFGKTDDPGSIDLSLPPDHPGTDTLMGKQPDREGPMQLFVGCAKWNRTDLKNFYPHGTKDELDYYSSQFNCIELNATFYRIFPRAQFEKWRAKTPDGFRFFPKVAQNVSHWGRLKDTEKVVDEVVHAFEGLEEKLGRAFLQMTDNFSPKDFDRVVKFVEHWPRHIPLAMEFRHTDWYNYPSVSGDLYALLEVHGISNVITDTAGRRDLVHMRLTTPSAFIRFTGANHASDRTRLDDWVERLVHWDSLGIREVDFFVHQNMELESPLLAAYFIGKMNERLGLGLKVPRTLEG